MNCRRTAVIEVLSKRKCCSIDGSWFGFLLLLLAAQAASRPTEEGDEMLNVDDEYGNVDNVEFHHVKMIDGILHEDHPIVMYKEDFVSEDFVPEKNRVHGHKKHKNIAHQRKQQNQTEQMNALKPEKIYFDVLPKAPIVIADDANDSKFDASSIHAELVPLIDEPLMKPIQTEDNESLSKDISSKHPKKFHKIHRRATDSGTEHKLRKRNPYNRYFYTYIHNAKNNAESNIMRHAVQGKRPNEIPDSVGTRSDFDSVIWDRKTTKSPNSNKVLTSIWHSSNPEEADFSAFDTPPEVVPSGGSRVPTQQNAAGADAAIAPTQAPRVSSCVWAIVNCCNSNDNFVRYYCFEEFGCQGAFWDNNPCTRDVRNRAVVYLDAISIK